MKPAYAPDNTRSSAVIVLALAIALTLIAVLIGLSDKPEVTAIAIAAAPAEPLDARAIDNTFTFETAEGTEAAGAAESVVTASPDGQTADVTPLAEPSPEATAPAVAALSEPTPTPQIAAAVAPTAAPEAGTSASQDPFRSTPQLPTSAGTVEGTFFTRPEEDEGAIVAENLITVTFSPDGTGSFRGALDISYPDGTTISLDMSGPLVWTSTTPQVKATLSGTYRLDAPVAADDVSTTSAELSITSLESGSGSLCTPKCFGFTFRSPTGT